MKYEILSIVRCEGSNALKSGWKANVKWFPKRKWLIGKKRKPVIITYYSFTGLLWYDKNGTELYSISELSNILSKKTKGMETLTNMKEFIESHEQSNENLPKIKKIYTHLCPRYKEEVTKIYR